MLIFNVTGSLSHPSQHLPVLPESEGVADVGAGNRLLSQSRKVQDSLGRRFQSHKDTKKGHRRFREAELGQLWSGMLRET